MARDSSTLAVVAVLALMLASSRSSASEVHPLQPPAPPPPPPPPPPTPSTGSTPTPPSSGGAPGQTVPLTGSAVVPGGRVINGFDWRTRRDGTRHFHYGADIQQREGSPIYAAASGVVKGIWRNGQLVGAGNTVALLHDDQRTGSVYMHLQRPREGLRVGQRLARGELLGYVGQTDSSDDGVFDTSPPHLHLELLFPLAHPGDVVRFDGRGFPPHVDPVAWSRANGFPLTGRG